MIKRTHRFHGHGSLKKVYAKGNSVRGGQMGMKFTQNKTEKPYRLAVVVSKKVHKSAVSRNRIRRRIYESFRTSTLQPKPGTDMIVTVFSDQVKETPTSKLNDLITSFIKKTQD